MPFVIKSSQKIQNLVRAQEHVMRSFKIRREPSYSIRRSVGTVVKLLKDAPRERYSATERATIGGGAVRTIINGKGDVSFIPKDTFM